MIMPHPHHKEEVRVHALILLLGIATLAVGYILWARICGM